VNQDKTNKKPGALRRVFYWVERLPSTVIGTDWTRLGCGEK